MFLLSDIFISDLFTKFQYNMSNIVQTPLLASLVPKLRSSAHYIKPVDVTSQPSLSPSICSTCIIMGFGWVLVGVLGAHLEFALHELFVKYSQGDVLWSQSRAPGGGRVEGCWSESLPHMCQRLSLWCIFIKIYYSFLLYFQSYIQCINGGLKHRARKFNYPYPVGYDGGIALRHTDICPMLSEGKAVFIY